MDPDQEAQNIRIRIRNTDYSTAKLGYWKEVNLDGPIKSPPKTAGCGRTVTLASDF
jgi:hypothetical protein